MLAECLPEMSQDEYYGGGMKEHQFFGNEGTKILYRRALAGVTFGARALFKNIACNTILVIFLTKHGTYGNPGFVEKNA